MMKFFKKLLANSLEQDVLDQVEKMLQTHLQAICQAIHCDGNYDGMLISLQNKAVLQKELSVSLRTCIPQHLCEHYQLLEASRKKEYSLKIASNYFDLIKPLFDSSKSPNLTISNLHGRFDCTLVVNATIPEKFIIDTLRFGLNEVLQTVRDKLIKDSPVVLGVGYEMSFVCKPSEP